MSRLQLNEPQEGNKYKEFYGRNVDKMPRLIAEGRAPMSFQDLMKRRLETQYASQAIRDAWMHKNFDTGDAAIYHPDGRIKVVLLDELLRYQLLEKINPKSKRHYCALVLSDGMYEKLEGQEFTSKYIQRYFEYSLTRKQAKSNPVWQTLSRDQELLNEYVDLIFSQAKRQFNKRLNMAVYIGHVAESPEMMLWGSDWLENGANAHGWGGFVERGGRLVGLAPDAQSEKVTSTLESKL